MVAKDDEEDSGTSDLAAGVSASCSLAGSGRKLASSPTIWKTAYEEKCIFREILRVWVRVLLPHPFLFCKKMHPKVVPDGTTKGRCSPNPQGEEKTPG